MNGSVAHHYGATITRCLLVKVNGIPVSTIDDFISIVQSIPNRSSVCLHTITSSRKQRVVSMIKDVKYELCYLMERIIKTEDGAFGWKKTSI